MGVVVQPADCAVDFDFDFDKFIDGFGVFDGFGEGDYIDTGWAAGGLGQRFFIERRRMEG